MRENGEIENSELAKSLILLSHSLESKPRKQFPAEFYQCKTCNRQFPSFQALGGHRASHNRPRTMADQKPNGNNLIKIERFVMKRKLHECSICGLEFAMGQALGGHMRRHRSAGGGGGDGGSGGGGGTVVSTVPVLKRSLSSRRVLCLDLNLTPLENDLELLFGKKAPKIQSLFL